MSEDIRNNAEKHRFEASVGDHLGVADYRIQGSTITFIHTGIPHELQGQGIATKLVKAALDSAREQGYRVVAQCPFVAQYIRRHPEYTDLLLQQ